MLPALRSLGITTGMVRQEARRIIEAVFSHYARETGKPLCVDKTPNYYRILPFIDDLFEGSQRFLFIARHPLDCISSLSAMYGERDVIHDPEILRSIIRRGRCRLAWAEYWVEVYTAVLGFRAGRADRCLLFRYEDLTRDTETTLRSVFAFLGERLPEDLVRTALVTAHTPGYEDAGIRTTAEVFADRTGRWRSWPAEEIAACWSAVAGTASELGYELT